MPIQICYGIDWDGPVPAGEDDEHVTVPPTIQPLSAQDYQELLVAIDPLAESSDHGIDLFLQCYSFVRSKMY